MMKHQNFFSGEFNLPKIEEKVLAFWKKNHIFEKSLAKNISQSSKLKARSFVFYEGPPYANGKPGIHHILARVVKDIILRFKSMQGYRVPRKAGWDTHGLPVEIAAEKALGLKSKKDIEKFGVQRFNEEAKKAVWLYKGEWERLTERIGYWLDLENAYVTYAKEYIETIWWTLKRIWERKLLYKGFKVVPWCTRCGTALSSHELALGYKETTDNSVYMRFRVRTKTAEWKNTSILSWTTTPWTLPGNVALAVNRKHVFVCVDDPGEKGHYLVLEKSSFERLRERRVFPKDASAHEDFSAKELVGLEYEPLFKIPALRNKQSYKVYAADFVTTEDGTGVVHTAVMYGEDDYKLGHTVGLPQHHTVTEEGKFTKGVPGLAGLYVKSKETEEKIVKHLEKNGNLLKPEPYTHEYPNCWRCETPMLYYARTSWFIAMSKLRKELLARNAKINWSPAHIKDGRFGEWLREAKDWNLSRERFWGAPLPIWECAKGHHEVIGGLEELSKRAGGARNEYWVMRHGESEANVRSVIDSGQKKFHLTPIGKDQVGRSVRNLQKEKIDLIITSDVPRARETALIAAQALGVKKVVADRRIREINLGFLTGKPAREYGRAFPTRKERFERRPERGESLRDLRARLWDFFQDAEKRYSGKRILLVSHEYPIWMMHHVALGWSEGEALAEKEKRGDEFIDIGGHAKLELKTVPRSDSGEADLHRPFTDAIAISCNQCGGRMLRIKEVADVWYDSGAMPFAQAHWPFAEMRNKKLGNSAEMKPPKAYPADYISEAVDQTRGWFYTLLAIATALGYEAPYKNVICLGLVNDKFGQKMSKSKGNAVDPWAVLQKYGADAVRWYFYTSTPFGEPKNFDEVGVAKALQRVHMIVYNSYVFWETYGTRNKELGTRKKKSVNILDKWILARLSETVAVTTKHIEHYEIREAALLLETFVDDLSRWYIRRSRRRLQKPESSADYESASATLRYVLLELVKLMAPFTPFLSEALYQKLGSRESVHLEEWPETSKKVANRKLAEAMNTVRKIASAGLAKRAELGIRVRQPLAKLEIRKKELGISKQRGLLDILADEVNVKKVIFNPKLTEDLRFDTEITPELKEEGIVREFVRLVQGLRQDAGLEPKDSIRLMIEAPAFQAVLEKNTGLLKKEVGAKAIDFARSTKFSAELETTVDSEKVWVGVKKI